MRPLIKKIHTYAGLLSFTLLLVYGIAGLTATIRKGSEGSAPGFGPPRFENFALPPGADTQQISDLVYGHIKPALVERLPADMVETDGDGNPRLDFWSINGVERVTVLAREGRLRIERKPSDLADFLSALHATLTGYPTSFPLIRIWGEYNHFGLICLLFLALSGAYLWLSSRPRYAPARMLVSEGCVVFALIYMLLR
jgi:hypothetical protein